MSKTTFPLHQQVFDEATDRQLSDVVSAVIAELRRRALLNKVYDRSATSITNNVMRNVNAIEAHQAAKAR